MRPLKLLLADDDRLTREGLAELLGERDDIDLVAVVGDGAAAIDALTRTIVDVALLDVDMPVLDGITAARITAARHPGVTVVMLTAFEQEGFLAQALSAGAQGFLTKDIPIDQLAQLLHSAAAGITVMGPRPTAMLAKSYREQAARREDDPEFTKAVDKLSPRLRNVFDLLTRAESNQRIADLLGLSEGTARIYVSQVLTATGCSSRAEVAVRAVKVGLGAPSDWLDAKAD